VSDLDRGVLYGIVRIDSSELAKTDLHSVYLDAGSAMDARERIYSGDDTRDADGYHYEVVPIAFGELLDPVILRVKLDDPMRPAE
jgi:hypothetical protein